MRTAAGVIAVACCLAAMAGIAYLHGFERALGHEEWRHRPALVEAYSSEVVFRAGPCALLAAAAALAAWFGVRPVATAAAAVLGAALATAGTYLTIREYIRTWPGGLMWATVWDRVDLALWAAGATAVLGIAVLGMK